LEYTGDAFVSAAAKNDLHAVKLFLAAGMDPNVKTKTDSTALREAIRAGHTAIVKELVQHKADFDGYELSRAAIQDNVELLRVMLEAGAKTDAKDEAFLFTASSGRFENMRALFDAGVELGTVGEEALRRAAGSRFNGDKASDDTQNDIVRFLIDLGVDPKAPDDKGMSALHYAARNGFAVVTRTLLDQGVKVNGKSKRGWTPLFEALYRYNPDRDRRTHSEVPARTCLNCRSANSPAGLRTMGNVRSHIVTPRWTNLYRVFVKR
jgi:ankyrin repeat protein